MREIVWKGNAACAVSITFNLAGETLWLPENPTNEHRSGVLSQGTYGPRVGVPLILDMLERLFVRATFFVPGWIIETYPETVKRIHRLGHEIGHYGYKHDFPDPDNPERERKLFQQGVAALERVTGERPVGFRSPARELTPMTLELLQANDFLYSSNLMDDFVPYLHPEGIVELPVHWVLNDIPFFMFQPRPPSRPIQPARLAVEAWEEELHGLYYHGGFVNLTLHPQFIGRPGRLQALERFLQTVGSYRDVWIAPLRDVARYWREEHS